MEDVKKHMDRLVNIKTAFREHLGVAFTKILEIVKRETDRSKYAEIQMKDDKITYTQDLLMVEREHIKRLERILENKEMTIDNKVILKGLEEGMETLKDQLKKDIIDEIRTNNKEKQEGKIDLQSLVPEIRKELEKIAEAPPRAVPLRKLTFAEAVGTSKAYREIVPEAPSHTIIISSNIPEDTGEDVITKLKDTLNAREDGLQIDQIRKVRNQKVLVSTSRKEDFEKIKTKVQKNEKLVAQETNNRNPLVLLRNVFKYITDDIVKEAITKQNKEMIKDLKSDEIAQTKVKYRRTARNPLQDNIILEVHPKLWQNLMASRKLFVDIQRVAVEDKSPLVQCTRCLGFGHGRGICTEQKDKCSHCGQEHLRTKCPEYQEGKQARCINCTRAGLKDLGHDALGNECPTRAKWDAIARSRVQYCC